MNLKIFVVFYFFDKIINQAGAPQVTDRIHVIMPTSLPQVNSPRLYIKNFPEPSGFNIDFGNTEIENKINTPTASIDLNNTSRNDEDSSYSFVMQNGKTFMKSRQLNNHKKNHNKNQDQRKLGGAYMNMEPGYFDIGSAEGSPLEKFTDQDMHDLNPYVPQRTPPRPVRIELKPYTPSKDMNITELLPAERKEKKLANQELLQEIDQQIENLSNDIIITKEMVKVQMDNVNDIIVKSNLKEKEDLNIENKIQDHVKLVTQNLIDEFDIQKIMQQRNLIQLMQQIKQYF